jgi:acyl-[acyl-carrier-protein]-phospholipid O-acyltransferase/long-chain-fatty-acid--[acyl-carrier-protein] ligase
VAVVTTPLDEKTILKQMKKNLPAIALPKIFIVWQTLPKMGSGKIDFRTISEMAREQLTRKSISQ